MAAPAVANKASLRAAIRQRRMTGPVVYRVRRPALAGAAVCEPRARYVGSGGRPAGDGLSEAILQAAWQRAGGRRLMLTGRDGRTYRVLYPGRPAPGRGPDFLDAILERDDGVRLSGDIEVHVRPAGWRGHGHSADRRYNGVIFHVALHAGDAASVTESGRPVPLLVLGLSNVGGMAGAGQTGQPAKRAGRAPAKHAGQAAPGGDSPGRAPPPGDSPEGHGRGALEPGPAPSGLQARLAPPPVPFMDLGAAGDQRFMARSSGFELEVRRAGPDQALYAGVLECLGYPRNRGAFRKLAGRIPWDALSADLTPGGETAGAEARLLWAAGSGPKPGGAPALTGPAPEWDLPGGRPDNHPMRRIAGAAALAARWLAGGGPAASLAAAVRSPATPQAVVRALTVQAEGSAARALIGASRAGEVATNAVLPGVHALARLRGDAALAARCLELYRSFPKLAENTVTKEARTLLAAHGLRPAVTGAREQQGLHFLYRAMTAPVVRPTQLPLL
jgi:hypothetical protein